MYALVHPGAHRGTMKMDVQLRLDFSRAGQRGLRVPPAPGCAGWRAGVGGEGRMGSSPEVVCPQWRPCSPLAGRTLGAWLGLGGRRPGPWGKGELREQGRSLMARKPAGGDTEQCPWLGLGGRGWEPSTHPHDHEHLGPGGARTTGQETPQGLCVPPLSAKGWPGGGPTSITAACLGEAA